MALPAPALAGVDVLVDKRAQRVTVTHDGGRYSWPASTGKKSADGGVETPVGEYGVLRMEEMHLSKKYRMSPMPHSLFFSGGFAIHGTYDVALLGRKASHGCVRLLPAHAARLYWLVSRAGMGRVRVVVVDPRPYPTPPPRPAGL